jgi:hypothetical protein
VPEGVKLPVVVKHLVGDRVWLPLPDLVVMDVALFDTERDTEGVWEVDRHKVGEDDKEALEALWDRDMVRVSEKHPEEENDRVGVSVLVKHCVMVAQAVMRVREDV